MSSRARHALTLCADAVRRSTRAARLLVLLLLLLLVLVLVLLLLLCCCLALDIWHKAAWRPSPLNGEKVI
jgi:hypothetical protein